MAKSLARLLPLRQSSARCWWPRMGRGGEKCRSPEAREGSGTRDAVSTRVRAAGMLLCAAMFCGDNYGVLGAWADAREGLRYRQLT